MTVRALSAACAIALCLPGAARAGCDGRPDPCATPLGTYQIERPAAAAAPMPAVVFLHGWGGTGNGTMSNRGMVEALLARGYAVIAPDGQPREGRDGRGWGFMSGRPSNRDDIAFLIGVADDAAARFGLDRDRMLLGGFSIGGSMTSYLACAQPDAFAAFLPVAGSFWVPEPATCAGPVRLLHTHGWIDRTVPLEGRPVGSGAVQGDVFVAMKTWRLANGCESSRPDAFGEAGPFWWRRWTGCAPGTALEFALHQGNHGVPEGWADFALDWFEGL